MEKEYNKLKLNNFYSIKLNINITQTYILNLVKIDWGLEIGDLAQSPNPKPQTPIPQTPFPS